MGPTRSARATGYSHTSKHQTPVAINLALELGYAKALGKKIILVDEKSAGDDQTRRYTGMLRATADITPYSLDEAITFLWGTAPRLGTKQ
jgi:hypothetical protein